MGLHKEEIEGVLFDVYDTLVSRSMSDFEKVKQLLPAHADPPSPENQRHARIATKIFYAENRHLTWAVENNLEFWQKYYELYLSILEVSAPQKKLAHELAAWSRDPLSYSVDSEASPVLKTLKHHGFTVGLLSNWDTSLASFCQKLGLLDLVDMVLASDEIGIRKPDPHIFLIAAEKLAIPPNNFLFIGDSLRKDIAGAKKAGMKTAWLNHSGEVADFNDNTRPDLIINHLGEVLNHVL